MWLQSRDRIMVSIPSLHQSEPESPFADIEDGLEHSTVSPS